MMDRPISSRGLYEPGGTQRMCQNGLRCVFRVVGIGRLRTRVAPNGRQRAGGVKTDGNAAEYRLRRTVLSRCASLER